MGSIWKAKVRKGNSYNARYDRQCRIEAIKLYGGKCARCGFADWRALQFDHTAGNGNQHRQTVAHGKGGGEYYLEIIRAHESSQFQILCANCNVIKRYENSEGVGSDTNEMYLKEMESVPIEISFC